MTEPVANALLSVLAFLILALLGIVGRFLQTQIRNYINDAKTEVLKAAEEKDEKLTAKIDAMQESQDFSLSQGSDTLKRLDAMNGKVADVTKQVIDHALDLRELRGIQTGIAQALRLEVPQVARRFGNEEEEPK